MNWVAISSPAKSWTVFSNQLYRFRSRVSCTQHKARRSLSYLDNHQPRSQYGCSFRANRQRQADRTHGRDWTSARTGTSEMHSPPNVNKANESFYSSLHEAHCRFVVLMHLATATTRADTYSSLATLQDKSTVQSSLGQRYHWVRHEEKTCFNSDITTTLSHLRTTRGLETIDAWHGARRISLARRSSPVYCRLQSYKTLVNDLRQIRCFGSTIR